MTLAILVLQKPHLTSKVKEHNKCIECRLSLWLDGDIETLVDEGHTTQRYLHHQINRTSDKGKAALHILSFRNNNAWFTVPGHLNSLSVSQRDFTKETSSTTT